MNKTQKNQTAETIEIIRNALDILETLAGSIKSKTKLADVRYELNSAAISIDEVENILG